MPIYESVAPPAARATMPCRRSVMHRSPTAQCGAAALSKALTAAGFQLKGSGWYATDFKGGQPAARAGEPADKAGSRERLTAAASEACGAGVAPCAVAGCPAQLLAPTDAAG
jgi:predicted nucleic acid-binding Zn ribbon protein